MEEAPEEEQTFKEKLLFYITAFFVLLGTFSLFAFLFLVPFVIDPAFTTIFMQFDLNPAQCTTSEVIMKRGTKNCTWASCREGCTKEVYNCTQIRVDYKITPPDDPPEPTQAELDATSPYPYGGESNTLNEWSVQMSNKIKPTYYDTSPIEWSPDWIDRTSPHKLSKRELLLESSGASAASTSSSPSSTPSLIPSSISSESTINNQNDSEWYFTGAKLFPNVKGCGYPPMLNCSIFLWKHQILGANYSCYYSKIDPALVISDLDMNQVYINLILATAIPIPSFIISVIYLAFAYFIIYAEEPVDPTSTVPNEGELDLEDGDKETIGLVIGTDGVEGDEGGGEEGLDGEDIKQNIENNEENDQQAEELPDKLPESPSEITSPPQNDLIKPAAMMVVRPSTLQPSGPIAAV